MSIEADVAGRLAEMLVRAGIERGLGRIDADIVARLLLPVVREIADQRAAEAWDEGHQVGWEHCQDGNYGNDHWDDDTPNPYRAALRALDGTDG